METAAGLQEAYQALREAALQLDREKQLRREAEGQLDALRQRRAAETTLVAQEIDRKREELRALRQERQEMKEFLDRGVMECRRVAEEVIAFKQDLAVRERTCGELTKERDALKDVVERLASELRDVHTALDGVYLENATRRVQLDDSTSNAEAVESTRRALGAECDNLQAQLTRMTARAKNMEAAEATLQETSTLLEVFIADVNALDNGVRSGNFELGDTTPPVPATAPRGTATAECMIALRSGVMPAGPAVKLLLQQAQESVARLRSDLRLFITAKQRRLGGQLQAHGLELAAATKERDTIVAQHNMEVAGYKQRIAELEREIVRIAEGDVRDADAEATERLALLDRLSGAQEQLQEEIARVTRENASLHLQLRKMKIDWSKVDESRKRFQQLKIEMQLLRDHAVKLEAENRNLRLFAVNQQGAGGGGGLFAEGAAESAQDRMRQRVQKGAFEAWKSQAFSEFS